MFWLVVVSAGMAWAEVEREGRGKVTPVIREHCSCGYHFTIKPWSVSLCAPQTFLPDKTSAVR